MRAQATRVELFAGVGVPNECERRVADDAARGRIESGKEDCTAAVERRDRLSPLAPRHEVLRDDAARARRRPHRQMHVVGRPGVTDAAHGRGSRRCLDPQQVGRQIDFGGALQIIDARRTRRGEIAERSENELAFFYVAVSKRMRDDPARARSVAPLARDSEQAT